LLVKRHLCADTSPLLTVRSLWRGEGRWILRPSPRAGGVRPPACVPASRSARDHEQEARSSFACAASTASVPSSAHRHAMCSQSPTKAPPAIAGTAIGNHGALGRGLQGVCPTCAVLHLSVRLQPPDHRHGQSERARSTMRRRVTCRLVYTAREGAPLPWRQVAEWGVSL
jgi:hypothetical protein